MTFKNKIILITGGTGSFGNAFLYKIVRNFSFKEIRILSRDEKKQEDMRKKFNNKKIKFFLGDVREKDSIKSAVSGSDYIFHAAALKQVPSCEFFPIEAVKTNILGTQNVLDLAIFYNVKKVVCLSTDKAVYPINAMGISKAMMEKVIISKARGLTEKKKLTKICITRYGNVVGSRGSVIPLFINQISKGKPLTVTDSKMTRFIMKMSDAIDLVLFAFKKGKSGDILIKKSPAATIENIIKALKLIYKCPSHKIANIGVRHGEKLHETLMTKEESINSRNHQKYFCISSDQRDLNYDKYFTLGKKKFLEEDYSSDNVSLLNIEQLKKVILDYKKNNFD
jgi:UDP-glucose 4-epimerase